MFRLITKHLLYTAIVVWMSVAAALPAQARTFANHCVEFNIHSSWDCEKSEEKAWHCSDRDKHEPGIFTVSCTTLPIESKLDIKKIKAEYSAPTREGALREKFVKSEVIDVNGLPWVSSEYREPSASLIHYYFVTRFYPQLISVKFSIKESDQKSVAGMLQELTKNIRPDNRPEGSEDATCTGDPPFEQPVTKAVRRHAGGMVPLAILVLFLAAAPFLYFWAFRRKKDQ